MSAESLRPSVAAILPAAGHGVRLGGERKQYRLLGGEPVLIRSLEVIAQLPFVREVVIAASADAREMTESLVSTSSFASKVSVVSGGSTRTESVRRALEAVPEDVDVVLVHDAVRPFIRTDQVDRVRRVAFEFGAASLAIPVANTLRRARNGVFTEPLDRDGAYSVQTPQAFRRNLLLESYESLTMDAKVTDDAAVVIGRGHQVHIVPGSILNMKITTEDDWKVASLLWPVWQKVMREES